jgi:uncharacterized protein involved in response to NO
MTSAQQMRAYTGPAVLSFGFRPFFLGASLWAALIVALWLPMLEGMLTLPIALSPIEWHVHELLYGFLPAVVAGFLLTAVPNWTGRLPILGTSLLALFALWLAGRVAVLASGITGLGFAAAVDLSFLLALIVVIGREIVAGNNTRNLRVLALVTLLFAGNAVFYYEAMSGSGNGYGIRIGVAAAVLLISLVGGRIIPSFTRNWLARQQQGRLPVPFNRYDGITIVVGAIALVAWIAAPLSPISAVMLIIAGALHVGRLARWAGERTSPETLVLVLHVGYAFVPLGYFLVALSILFPSTLLPTGAVHAWTIGAIGLMTLAVMTRASLGHSGRDLTASAATGAIYLAIVVAAVARLAAGFDIAPMPMLHLAAAGWVFAYAAFAVVYWPMLTKPRLKAGK